MVCNIDDDAPVDVSARTRWLDKQRDDDLKAAFKPQPWEQLIKVLRAIGYLEEAKGVAIKKQKRLQASGKITGIRAVIHDAYGFLYGYGYEPARLAKLAVAIALVFAGVFWATARRGVMVPTDRQVLEKSKEYCQTEDARDWTKCEKLKLAYTAFNPLLYSLDLILPLAGFNQTKNWAPRVVEPHDPKSYAPLGVLAAVLGRLESMFGWLAGLMFVAVASGFVKKD